MKVGEVGVNQNNDSYMYVAEKNTDMRLHMDKYQSYYNAIICDDVSGVDEFLSTCTTGEKDRMLNGRFMFETVSHIRGCKSEIRQHIDVQRPLGVAAGSAALNVLERLIDYHINVMYTENGGKNVIHVLILTSEMYPDMEERFLDVYLLLCKKIPHADLVQLLLAENQSGIRPVELAAERGSYQILEAIFETRGVYLTKIQNEGMASYHWYDVTEYETTEIIGKRRILSPLNLYVKPLYVPLYMLFTGYLIRILMEDVVE